MNMSSAAKPLPPKSCNICGNEESSVAVPSISGNQHFCLVHYFTTGAHRNTSKTQDAPQRNKKNSLLVDSATIHEQLPHVQEIFAEAFTELQKEIREESARVFKSAANSDDPLAMLLDGNTSTQSRRTSFGSITSAASRRKRFKEGNASDGGFLRK